MKGIEKNEPPVDFEDFKAIVVGHIPAENHDFDDVFYKSPYNLIFYRSLTGESFKKANVRELLLKEQGYLCCYCCRKIFNDKSMVIEHFKPQSKFKEYALE